MEKDIKIVILGLLLCSFLLTFSAACNGEAITVEEGQKVEADASSEESEEEEEPGEE